MGTPTQGGVASCHGVARSAKTEMPMLQYVASLSATPPSGGVRIDFLRYSHGSAAQRLYRGLSYAASPCGEALNLARLRLAKLLHIVKARTDAGMKSPLART